MSLKDIGTSINNALKSALFMEALRNLAWSRGYLWYVELDTIPNPFNRGSVIGLPVTDVSFQISQGVSFTWEAGIEQLSVPHKRNICKVHLDLIDDEKSTVATFFERWHNSIYNTKYGVLPATEACRCISIYKLKATRSKITRTIGLGDGTSLDNVDGRQFLVYPEGDLTEILNNAENGPRKYSIDLVICKQLDADHGNPSSHEGQKKLLGIDIGGNTSGKGFLDKIANYI